MKISALMAILAGCKRDHGDATVTMYSSRGEEGILGLTFTADPDGSRLVIEGDPTEQVMREEQQTESMSVTGCSSCGCDHPSVRFVSPDTIYGYPKTGACPCSGQRLYMRAYPGAPKCGVCRTS